MQRDLVQAERSISDLGWVLTAWRSSLPWLKPGRRWAHCRKWSAVFMGCKGLPARSSRHSFPAGRHVHHASHSQPGLETTQSLTPRTATVEVVGTSDKVGISPFNQISGRISNHPRRLVLHTAFLLAFKMPGLLRNKVTDGHFAARPTTFAVLFWLKQPCRVSHIRSLRLEAGVSYIHEPAQVTDPACQGPLCGMDPHQRHGGSKRMQRH